MLPVYNNVCFGLVQQIQEQTATIRDLRYEVIVIEDGSTDVEYMKRNSSIIGLRDCRYIVLEENIGRAAVRNLLAQQAKYDWLLFLDSDVLLQPFFLEKYLDDHEEEADVICGGVRVLGDELLLQHNLRFKYEYNAQPHHLFELRQAKPYHNFRTPNFCIKRDVMLSTMFDERFKGYGYEDVLFGKTLHEKNISILHIDNPVILHGFENNREYVEKVEDAMRTLHTFRNELRGYSPILDLVEKSKWMWVMKLWHFMFGWLERMNLIGKSPSLTILKFYKLGYYLTLKH